jgi:GMP synthase (glutamine-hydrolysing)
MITHLLGGEVKPAVHGGEYGRMPIDVAAGSTLFGHLDKPSVNVWMSHGDEAVVLPEGFSAVAKSRQVRALAYRHDDARLTEGGGGRKGIFAITKRPVTVLAWLLCVSVCAVS